MGHTVRERILNLQKRFDYYQHAALHSHHAINLRNPSIIKSWSQSFRRSLKLHGERKRLMTWSIHPSHKVLACTMKLK